MKCLIVLAVVLGVSTAGVVKRQAQSPGVFSALDLLRGKSKLSNDDIRNMVLNAQAGQDYPNLSSIPDSTFDCSAHKPGFYADVSQRCQVVRRCDVNGNQTSFLCPNMTVFNQITLVCHWFWDVDCSKSETFYDYSNSRLYQENAVLLDDETTYEETAAAISASPKAVAAPKAAARKAAAPKAAAPKTASKAGSKGFTQ
ncbi:uncharacterized protein LOC129587107 [Paramacrobiotus metropolitanus]|uniref:uncharacterized protein LOC129587107 n=1 Tax=Paramacrobiotus metropolitanus TaxID=2943436 RepID=UPI002445C28F|nr:uncharacterized protein LOC129587107 [Paramacrobiotus metropolitanus]